MPSVAMTTVDLYSARVRSFQQARPDLTLSDPAGWITELKARNLSLASLKSYASAIRYHARQLLDDATNFISSFDIELEKVQLETQPAVRRRRPTIHEDVLAGLRSAADHRSGLSDFTHAAVDLAEGSFYFGLRPSEWTSTIWDNGILTVKNGKYLRRIMEHGIFKGRIFARANGISRSLTPLPHPSRKKNETLIDNLLSFQSLKPFRKHHRAVQIEFRKIVALAIARGYIDNQYSKLTLYSFRHQFAATAKANLSASSGEVAALMGHISARTALQSYARRACGRIGGLAVEPSAQSVEAVENLGIFMGAIFDTDGSVIEPAIPFQRAEPTTASRNPISISNTPAHDLDGSEFKPPGAS